MNFFLNTNLHLYIAIILSVVNGAMLCFAGSKLFQIIQLSGYRISGYRAWIKDTKVNFISRLFSLAFLSTACVLVVNALLDGFDEYFCYIGLIFYFYFTIIFIANMFAVPQKTPLKQTKRMNRLTVLVFIIMSFLTFALILLFSEYVPLVKFSIVAITPIFLPIIVPLAHLIMVPFEYLIRLFYINKAKKKLNNFPNLIKIGITGSYGKTTTKNMLNIMLSKKYSVCMSPHSFNTPMGLTKVILNYLKPENQVLIAEMGARQVGDIEYLCKLIKPKHAIITAVGNQHLATFGSQENVIKAKSELIDAIDDGFVVFNGQNDIAVNLYKKYNKQKVLCGIENNDCFVNITDVVLNKNGTSFILSIEGNKVECTTKLIGRHNLEDIAVSCGLAYKLGLNLDEIKQAIGELKPLPHRMEIIEENGLIIIDNAFNSSVESSKSSFETLSLFEGNKIVVTPGLVELGAKEREENEIFGSNLSKVANKVIIVNKVNKDSIISGLLSNGFDEKNIVFAENLNQAKDILKNIVKNGDIILFENDLPDNYT